MNSVDDKKLDSILKATVIAMEESKTQIFDIYEGARAEVDHIKADIERIKTKLGEIILSVDELERKERESRQMLVTVSSNFRIYTEEDIKICYDNAKNIQIGLAVMREQELNLRQQRDAYELRLKELLKTVGKAKQLVTQVGVVLGYLSVQIGDVVTQIEAVNQDKLFGAQVIKAQEEERLRVSREIHDGPAQLIANVIYRSSICERLVDIDTEKAKRELREIREQIRSCLGEIRKIIFDLRPMALDDLGLIAAIHQFIEKFRKRTDIAVQFEVIGQEYVLAKHIEISLFRLIQESLNNINKHAQTKQAKVVLEYNREYISIFIQDEGKGFIVEAADDKLEKTECYGLLGMRERVKLLNGQFLLDSVPGTGTKIRILVPVKDVQTMI